MRKKEYSLKQARRYIELSLQGRSGEAISSSKKFLNNVKPLEITTGFYVLCYILKRNFGFSYNIKKIL